MAMAIKVVRCVASFSRSSLSPAVTVQRGLTAQLRRRFISSSGRDREAATSIKVDVENRRMGASNFMNKTGVKPAEVSVGNGLMVDVMMSPSTGTFKQTTIMDEGARTIHLDIQATTSTDSCALDAILPIYTGLYGNPRSLIHPYGWETNKVIDIAREHVAKLNGAYPKRNPFTLGAMGSNDMSIKYVARLYKSKKHIIVLQREPKCVLVSCRYLQDEWHSITYLPVENNDLIYLGHLEKEICPGTALVSIKMVNNEIKVIQQMEEIGKLYRKQGVFFHTDGAQTMGKIPVDVGKWNVDSMSIPCPKIYGPKGIRVGYIQRRPKVRIDPPISGGSQERGLCSGTFAHSLVFCSRKARRISEEQIEYTRTLKLFFSLNLICSSTVQDDSYIHKRYHNKQSKQFTRALWTTRRNRADMEKSRRMATTNDSGVGIQEANLPEVPNTKAAGDTDGKRRNLKWSTSYSKITIREAQKRLGVRLNLPGIPLKRMLEGKQVLLGPDMILQMKRKIYHDLVNYMEAGGYPTEADADFKEANINDIVSFTIYPMIAQFKRETKRKLHLSREKEITSIDSSTSGMEEFVVMDYISLDQEKYVLIVEAKKVSLGEARKQCFLAMKDMWDSNGGGIVYGFVTMGDLWRMVSFDGEFKMSEPVLLLFDTMAEDEERWIADYSGVIDCFNTALSLGGMNQVEVV